MYLQNDGAKADTLRNAYKKTYKPTGSSSGSLTKNNKKTKVANNQNNKKEGDDDGDTDAKVEVKNVLYGMNQGFIGVNFSAEVKNSGLHRFHAEHRGTLEVNTVNDWSMGVEGSASFLKSITLEIKLGIKSKNKIPVVDNLYFYVEGINLASTWIPSVYAGSSAVAADLKICMIRSSAAAKYLRSNCC